jgi:predicted dinucleotide-binding enzyme
MFGVPDTSDPKLASVLKEAGSNPRASGVAEAAAFGEVVVLATPWPAAQTPYLQQEI